MKTFAIFASLLLMAASFGWSQGTYHRPADIILRAAWNASPVVESNAPGERMEPMGTVSFITVHQTESTTPKDDPASEREAIRQLQGLHQAGKIDAKTGRRINRMGDLAYHFLIAPSGRVYEGRSTRFQTNSNTSYLPRGEREKSERFSFDESEKDKEGAPWGGEKRNSELPRPGAVAGHVTIVFVGNYIHTLPPKPALDAFVTLLADQLTRYHLSIRDVLTHRELARTDCPGEPLYVWLRNPPKNPLPNQYGTGEGLARVDELLRRRRNE